MIRIVVSDVPGTFFSRRSMISPQTARESERVPYARWICLLVLLIAEFIAISLRYDAQGIGPDRALHGLIMYAGVAARFGIAVALGTLIVIGGALLRLTKAALPSSRSVATACPRNCWQSDCVLMLLSALGTCTGRSSLALFRRSPGRWLGNCRAGNPAVLGHGHAAL